MNAVIYVSIAILMMGASTCKKHEPPAPDVKLYIGDSEDQTICREDDNGIKECIYTSSKQFDEYQAMHVDDVAKVLHYINELRSKCTSFKENK